MYLSDDACFVNRDSLLPAETERLTSDADSLTGFIRRTNKQPSVCVRGPFSTTEAFDFPRDSRVFGASVSRCERTGRSEKDFSLHSRWLGLSLFRD